MACLTDDDLCALMEGRLEGTAATPVHNHLDSCPECRVMCAALGRSMAPAPQLVEGQRIDHYLLGRRLGQGGMGMVFQARDTRLGRQVALKFILPHILNEEQVLARFRREARAAGSLDHPNLCAVLDVGEDPACPYLALAFVEGDTLKQRLARGALPPDETLDILRQIAAGLATAHAAGIVHRDVKPGNVMVTAGGQVKVLDFGLAKRQDESQSLTQTGDLLGTAVYMAPEQHRGEAADARADVWALGVLGFEMLTGKPPFTGPNTAALSFAVLEREPPPLPPSLPAGLRAIVGKCLEKRTVERYADAGALWADLERLAAGGKVAARGPSRLRTTFRRRKKALVAGAMVAVALAGVAGWGLRQQRAARERARLAERVGRSVQEMRSRMRSAYLMPFHEITPERETVKAQIREIEGARLDGELRSAGEYALGEGWLALGDHEKARPHFQSATGEHGADFEASFGLTLGQLYIRALSQAQAMPVGPERDAAEAKAKKELRDPAIAHLRAGARADMPPDYVEALIARYEFRHQDCIQAAHRAFGRTPLFYEAGAQEADCYAMEAERISPSDPKAALALFERAVAAYGTVIEIGRSDPALYRGRATALLMLGWRADLIEGRDGASYLRRGKEDADRALELDPGDGRALAMAAQARTQLADEGILHGRPQPELLREAVALAERATKLDPSSAPSWEQLGNAYANLVDLLLLRGDDAQAEFEHAAAAYRRAIALDATGNRCNNLGLMLSRVGWYHVERGVDPAPLIDEALGAFDQAEKLHSVAGAALIPANRGWARLIRARWELTHGGDPSAQLDAADEELRRSSELDPTNTDAVLTMSESAWLRGRYALAGGRPTESAVEAALATAQRCIKMNAAHPLCHEGHARGWWLSAQAQLAAGNDPSASVAKARAAVEEAMKANPDDSGFPTLAAWIDLTEARRRPSALAAAKRHVDACTKLNPRRAECWLLDAEVHRRRVEARLGTPAELAAGVESAERALALHPDMAQARLVRAALWKLQKDARAGDEHATALHLNRHLEHDLLLGN